MPSENAHTQAARGEVASLEPGTTRPPSSPRGAVIYLFVTLGALAAFVWALGPDRPNVRPAPLQPQAAPCPQLAGQFTPTNFTELPGLELASLSKQRRNKVLLRLNMEVCPCGCDGSVAYCLASHPGCDKCKERAKEVITEER